MKFLFQLVVFLQLQSASSFCFQGSVQFRNKKNDLSTLWSAASTDEVNMSEHQFSGEDLTGGENFWGRPRSEQEIVDFVSNAVFDNDDSTSSEVISESQWVEVISEEPPLLIVHGFLEPEYCDDIVQAVLEPNLDKKTSSNPKSKLQRSTMGADQTKSDERTSSTAWLREKNCPLPLRTFATRTSQLSGLPTSNMENLQVVRYQVGEEFQMHTDHLDSFNEFDVGGRLATCLVYLNDPSNTIEENTSGQDNVGDLQDDTIGFTGGETFFHEFNVAIPPKKGSALFFWNTKQRPGSRGYDGSMFLNVDRKLRHAGLPVLSGEKWVANRWIHPVNFGAGVRGLS